ncbi:hypothetical protein B0H14DRAFT_3512674 [Mycena olivaceomarginata]|nr:hypothetical protein B0H14DRAFT_3520401 [Mycena olivaceomarginata]KAJ7722164.1 hypothetical protein B0H14DRAFT_3520402 [Mycena olivaceomarginata]KAJ7753879.1 hypothetical protein B0H14DRAFT_3512674 [Mycena olivaceomarginata]
MVRLTSTFIALVSCIALSSAAPTNMVKKALSTQAHNAIDAAALADHGDHSHNLVVNDPDFPGSPANVCDNVATGTVWVEYNDKVDGHFKFIYSMDDILTPEERTVA